jgi:DNA-binding NtrC family response regulator
MKMKQRIQHGTDNDEPHGGEFKVLIFDNDAEDLVRHAKPFEARGFDVCKCSSIEAAMRCLEREEFDFAMVDQGSKAFEGGQVIRHLIRYNLLTPFVVLAEHKHARCHDQALALGAIDYLEKPVSNVEMNSIIQKYFGNLSEQRSLS